MANEESKPVPLSAFQFAEFLEDCPPNQMVIVADALRIHGGNERVTIELPTLQLHCPGPLCGGVRQFNCDRPPSLFVTSEGAINRYFFEFNCRNCTERSKLYSLIMIPFEDSGRDDLPMGQLCKAQKLGELPAFGPMTPARLISLMGPARELFLQGRQAENLGLGIGALTYYRRAIEMIWRRFIGEVHRVAVRIGASEEMQAKLEEAGKASQFRDAVEHAKGATPDQLKIKGQDPVRLLYAAVSVGLHEDSDAACLQSASAIRTVMTEIADRMSQALKDERELTEAIKLLGARIEAQEAAGKKAKSED